MLELRPMAAVEPIEAGSASAARSQIVSTILFQPNDLSRLSAKFQPLADGPLRDEIRGMLRDCYAIPDSAAITIESIVGANALSLTFRSTVNGSRLFLKSRTGPDALDRLTLEAQTVELLAARDIPVPTLIRASRGEAAVAFRQRAWLSYRFEDGNYFQGHGSELESAASVFDRLTCAATDLHAAGRLRVNTVLQPALSEIPTLISEALRRPEVDPAIAGLCSSYAGLIQREIDRVLADQDVITALSGPLHLDYHPLNLLMRGGAVATVLDFEDLTVYPIIAGTGFAAFKLIRQAMVSPVVRAGEEREPRLVARWLAAGTPADLGVNLNARLLGLGATFRVLTLIHLILGSYLRHFDARFNYDLGKQMTSLKEIGFIFGSN